MHNPWQAFRALTHISLRWAQLPDGLLGYTDFDLMEVVLSPRLDQAQRRCTIAHETQHLLRGPVPEHFQAREEVTADKIAARLLLPDIKVVGEALAWARSNAEAADELWVDEAMLRCRLDHLHPAERGYLKKRLAEFEDPGHTL